MVANLLYFTGYIIGDLILQVFLVKDFTSSQAKANYIHHVLGLIGTFGGVTFGGFVGSFAYFSLFTECSTLFVNIRWFLFFHGLKDTNYYFYNGLVLTAAFFVFRVVLQTWLLSFKLRPAV
jgi:hypothetical protein